MAPAALSPGHSVGALIDIIGMRWVVLRAALVPFLVASPILVLTHPKRLSAPLSAIITVALAAIVTVAVLSSRRWLPGRFGSITLMSAFVAGLWLESAPWGWRGDGGSDWAVPAIISPGLTMLAYHRPFRETVPGLLVVTGSVAWLVARGAPDGRWVSAGLGTIMSPVIAFLAVAAIRVVIEKASPILAATAAAQFARADQDQRLLSLRTIGEARIHAVRQQVRPFLDDVGSGRTRVDDHGARRQAVVLEAAVRDDLQLGVDLSPLDRFRIQQTRERGITVEIAAGPRSTAPQRAMIGELLGHAMVDLAEYTTGRIVVSCLDPRQLDVLISPATAPGTAAFTRALGGEVRASGHLLLASVPVHVPEFPDYRR